MGKVRRWGDPLDGPVGQRWRKQDMMSTTDDQEYVIGLLNQLDSNLGGKKDVWSAYQPPSPGPDRHCDPDLVDAIFDFQNFWVSQGRLKIVDGVFDRHGPSLRLAELATMGLAFASDPLKALPPEGQLDATACWAACYAWWLLATPGEMPVSQSAILVAGAASGGMVNSDGTVNVNGFMTFLSGRHQGLRTSRIPPGELPDFLATSKLPAHPIIIALGNNLMGGHVNVIHAFDSEKNTVSVMECWYPDPSADPNYVFSKDPAPLFSRTSDGAPFKFTGAHLTRPVNYYVSQPYQGKLLVFPDHR